MAAAHNRSTRVRVHLDGQMHRKAPAVALVAYIAQGKVDLAKLVRARERERLVAQDGARPFESTCRGIPRTAQVPAEKATHTGARLGRRRKPAHFHRHFHHIAIAI